MTLFDYQETAMSTCMETCNNISYMLINLVGEVGEFSSKLAKLIRQGKVRIENNKLIVDEEMVTLDEFNALEQELQLEAGDILWQLSGLMKVMGWKLEDVATMNLMKLHSRQKRGKIDGDGDNR